MMQKERLIKEMEVSIEHLVGETEDLTDEAFEHERITGVWATREILCHVAAWDLQFIEMSKSLLKGDRFQFPDFDTFNAREVEKRKTLSRKEITNEVRKNRALYTTFISAFTEEELSAPRGGRTTVGGLAEDIMSHDKYHLEQITLWKKHTS